jgi:hypothetical protein|nr:MAG TPA: hypothetical protein [Caudoviricetes sp.]DAY39903.1 MAG TPA: hypothetical protein [Caudoviricetes sp.]
MLDKYDTFLRNRLKAARGTEREDYWLKEYMIFESYLQDINDGIPTSYYPHEEFMKNLKCIFSNTDTVSDVLAYCYDELPILSYKDIKVGDKDISTLSLNQNITVNYDTQDILIGSDPVTVNGYSLFTLTSGIL